jgi:hypothetical protein
MGKRLLIPLSVVLALVWPFLVAELTGRLVLARHCDLSDGAFILLLMVGFIHVPVLAVTVFRMFPANLDVRVRLVAGLVILAALLFAQMWAAGLRLVFLILPCA